MTTTPGSPNPATADLARRLYVELVARASSIGDGKVKFAANAREMAALCIQLADAFVEIEETIAAGKMPKKAFSLDADEVATWGKT